MLIPTIDLPINVGSEGGFMLDGEACETFRKKRSLGRSETACSNNSCVNNCGWRVGRGGACAAPPAVGSLQ